MIVRVLMIRLHDHWKLHQVADLREGAPEALTAAGLPADKVHDVATLEAGYCQLTEAQWKHYTDLYTLNCHRGQT